MQAFRSAPRLASHFRSTGLPTLARGYATQRSYEHLLVSTPKTGVGLIQLNRPKALNALSTPLILEVNQALRDFQHANDIGAIVLTGSERAFAAGADIKEMKDLTFSDAYGKDFIESWSDLVTFLKKPLITAVNGYALGGGCELAMMGDIMYAGPKAMFGQPEIKLGTIPGAGGSQRLTKAIGKSRAMETILTGDNITAKQAGEWGLVAKVFDTPEECVDGAIATAAKIASYSQIAVKAAKEVVNKSQELGIREGVEYERRVFHGLFGSEDQKIGMAAFAAKAKPEWQNK
ncbi:enoyl-CoA hydratase mitochondrial precursor [Stemphylium lycopersici]|uniref:Probable enoyl-CoA hydratase, mitochondrial n=1 Tax=Stemphylium lycopersici TaxID=183478 RepID=A0A364MRP3_STELY|nr:enoyl-CoA hydratase [Stemphylium lycopersici]RAR00885.1 enoyl-CoA hydratase mitochondrial precursor [Stemphylium lycopersici]RAR07863.1 enoyl-CoA hydratase mitochondrial precursor [Stemphylium lycopersici]